MNHHAPAMRGRSRVLLLHHEASNSGSTRLFLDFLTALHRQDLDFSPVVCFYRGGPLLGEAEALGLPVHVIDRAIDAMPATRTARLRSLLRFTKLLVHIRPALLYANTVTMSYSVMVAGLLGVRTLVHVHEGPRFLDRAGVGLRLSAHLTKRFVTGSRYAARGVLDVLGRSSDVIRNWSSVRAASASARKAANRPLRIGMVGTVDRNKQHSLALLALAALKPAHDIRLVVVGSAPDPAYRRDLDDIANLLGVSADVEFAGEIRDPEAIYPGLDAVLIASMEETFSLVALEAAEYGKPVAAADVGGLREALRDHDGAVFFRAGDWDDLAAVLAGLLAKEEGANPQQPRLPAQRNSEGGDDGPRALIAIIRAELQQA